MVAYTSALLAAASLLAVAHAAPAPGAAKGVAQQPVCKAVTTVITGSPIWVPAPAPTGPNGGKGGNGGNGGAGQGWGPWPSTTTTTTKKGKGWSTTSYTTTFAYGLSTPAPAGWSTTYYNTTFAYGLSTPSPISVSTSTITPTISLPTTSPAADTTTYSPPAAATTTTPAPAPAPTCASTGNNVFSTSASGSCGCDFTVNCNMHAPYTSSTNFWERTTGEIVNSLSDCLAICNDNSACTAVVWSNQDGESSNDYMRCWQTSGLPQPDSTGYGQLSYKGACSSSCAQSYDTSPSS